MVAVNPFKKVPLYGNNYIEAYKRKATESPHVYAITDTAIREMIRGNFLYPRMNIYGWSLRITVKTSSIRFKQELTPALVLFFR